MAISGRLSNILLINLFGILNFTNQDIKREVFLSQSRHHFKKLKESYFSNRIIYKRLLKTAHEIMRVLKFFLTS